MKTATRCPKVIWEQAASPSVVEDSLIAATHSHSTILTRRHQCIFLCVGPTP